MCLERERDRHTERERGRSGVLRFRVRGNLESPPADQTKCKTQSLPERNWESWVVTTDVGMSFTVPGIMIH